MKGKRGEEEEGHENSERWLLTYSDLITLLLALFIILYTMSSVDLEKLKELSKNLSSAFNNSSASESAGAGSGGADSVTGGGAETSVSGYSGDSAVQSPLDEIYKKLNTYIENNNLQGQIDLENTDTYVKVCLKDAVLFVPDSSDMKKVNLLYLRLSRL